MSGTQIDLTFTAVVNDLENQPPWVQALAEGVDESCDDIVRTMLEAEMRVAGQRFINRWPDMFRGTGLL